MRVMESLETMIRRRAIFVLVAAGLLVAGCGGTNEGSSTKVEVVQGLQVRRVQLQTVPSEFEAPGNVIAVSAAQVAARTMGTVLQVAVKEGDMVKRGQLLAQLDERELASHRNAAQSGAQAATAGVAQAQKAVEAAQAQADVMQKTFDRYSYLKEQKSVSPQEFDEVTAKQKATQATLEQAKAGLRQAEAGASGAESEARAAQDVAGYARIVAPFDGRVIRRTVEAGSLVSPGMPLFVVEDISHYQLEVTLPGNASGLTKKNVSARIELDGLPGKSLSGKVAELEAGADPNSHTLRARIDLPKEVGVQSGMFGRAFFAKGEKQALLVPLDSVVSRGQLRGVYIVDDAGLLHWRVVTLGKPLGEQIEALSGLNDGDVLVLSPGNLDLDGKKSNASAGGENHS